MRWPAARVPRPVPVSIPVAKTPPVCMSQYHSGHLFSQLGGLIQNGLGFLRGARGTALSAIADGITRLPPRGYPAVPA